MWPGSAMGSEPVKRFGGGTYIHGLRVEYTIDVSVAEDRVLFEHSSNIRSHGSL
jgi:hypothetical protein